MVLELNDKNLQLERFDSELQNLRTENAVSLKQVIFMLFIIFNFLITMSFVCLVFVFLVAEVVCLNFLCDMK